MAELLEWAQLIVTIISFLVALGNILLLVGLLRTFYNSYKKIKAKFTKGLLFFVTFLLIQQIAFLSGLIMLNALRDVNAGGPIFFLNVMEFIALIIFYRTTRE